MAKTKIDLSVDFKGLDGKPLEGGSIGKALAERIAQSNTKDSPKLMLIAFDLYSDKPVELDSVDLALLRKFVEDDAAMTNLFKYRILEKLK
ncbi:hypothetical protein [Flectobacillus sp. BAB-3569]|uniref:hypothetical protein n=1 Tax=Flectobacillus sp. BAB-3569 TaxID=1509483 RepID=UPI000BA49D44|nr:hypothetical protein [Flectobacillus sp. BAB-3569]PAC33376.1 hypothetical protein BWI92_02375 [Flectobacillus sp. BAB-3569]